MASESLIVRDGFLRSLPDGSLVTDRDGAPCCCGGAPGCCICGDTAAEQAKPCYVDYFTRAGKLPTERYCNPTATCCCGQKIRVTFTQSGAYQFASEYGNENVTVSETGLVEVELVGGENCTPVHTPIAHSFDLVWTDDGGLIEEWSIKEPTNAMRYVRDIGGKFIHPNKLCRPEPEERMNAGWLYGPDMFNPYPFSDLFKDFFGPRLYPTWWQAFGAMKPCGDTLVDGFGNSLAATVKATCGLLAIQTNFLSGPGASTVSVEQAVSMSVGSLNTGCCGDDHGPIPGDPSENPPGNPGQPGGSVQSGCGGCQDGGL